MSQVWYAKGDGRWAVKDRNGRNYYWYRIVMWNEFGRELRRDEDVHHINGDKSDDRLENLTVLSRREHFAIHRAQGERDHVLAGLRESAQRANDARNRQVTLSCSQCGDEFKRSPSQVRGVYNFCSRACNAAFQAGRHSKLSDQQIREILASDKSDRALAREYGVCNHTIAACKRAA